MIMEPKNWNVYLFRDILERVEVPVNVESNKEYVQLVFALTERAYFIKNQFWEKLLETSRFSGFSPIALFLTWYLHGNRQSQKRLKMKLV